MDELPDPLNLSEDELLFTYVLLSGILLRFSSARAYTWNRELVTGVLGSITIGGVSPRRTDYENRNQLQRHQRFCRYKLGIILHDPVVRRSAADHPLIQVWKMRCIDYLYRSNTDFWKIWRNWIRDSNERREVTRLVESLEDPDNLEDPQILESHALETPHSMQS